MRFRSRTTDRRAIGYHYDLSNAFYALFLDPRMLYTCGYYRQPDASLETAQEDKLELICRKLDLRPGERLLDIGCGWGGLVAWAAERYGVEAHGVTLSTEQVLWAEQMLRRTGLTDRVRVELRDWRDLPPGVQYDKIAAIGVIEHVGPTQTPAWLDAVHARLAPGGRFLLHGITHEKGWRYTGLSRFLERYVFPNGEIQNVSEILDRAERARFEIEHVESLRPHYVRTTRQWAERLQANAEAAVALVGQRTYRIWLAYLAGASAAFAQGSIGIYQTVLRKPDPAAAVAAPSTCARWYADDPRPAGVATSPAA